MFGRFFVSKGLTRPIPDRCLVDLLSIFESFLVELLRDVGSIFDRRLVPFSDSFGANSREKGVLERVEAAGRAIVTASIEAGGVLSGEHGIGLEKRDYMGMLFSAHDMVTQDLVREAFDPEGLANPLKILPSGARCSDSFRQHVPEGAWV